MGDMTRHEFLAALHELLQPQSYLEVGVQHGWSLQLSKAPISFGVDPKPLVNWPNVIRAESDALWAQSDTIKGLYPDGIDMVFIDGMHLFEYALRDFMGVLPYLHERSVVVFDDVLPRNHAEAHRVQCPGDWTGDVWKIRMIAPYRPDLRFQFVDTQPTGVLAVTGFGAKLSDVRANVLDRIYNSLLSIWSQHKLVPDDVLNRAGAEEPYAALDKIQTALEAAKREVTDS